MKNPFLIPFLMFALFWTAGCTREDENRAKAKAKQATEELKRDAHRFAEDTKKEGHELDKKAGPKLHQAGEELKQDAQRANQKLKQQTQKLDREVQH